MFANLKTVCIAVTIIVCAKCAVKEKKPKPELREDPMHSIFMSQLDGECLPGDNDQNDQIYLYHVNDTVPTCVPDGYVGVRLELGQYAENWKAMALHRKDDYDSYRNIIQMQDKQKPPTAFFDLNEFFTHDLCLWKEVDDLIGTSRTNMYRLVDAEIVMREEGGVFNFVWFRDDTCVEQIYPVEEIEFIF